MKKRIIFVFITSICIISMLLLPCSAAVGDIEKAVIIDRVYGSATSDYSKYYMLDQLTMEQGDSGIITTSLASVPVVPNYFFDQFHFYMSDGMPIASGGSTWRFLLANYNNGIDHEQDGYFPLKTVNEIRVWFFYSDGQQSGVIYNTGTSYVYDTTTGMSSLSFSITPTRKNADVTRITVQVRSDITCFGLDPLTSSSNLYDYVYYVDYENVSLARSEVFPSANGAPLDEYEKQEGELIDATSGGIHKLDSVFYSLKNIVVPDSSVYKGALFFSNLMTDLITAIPDLDYIIVISLSLGLIMVVLGSVLFSISSSKGDKVKSGKSKGG